MAGDLTCMFRRYYETLQLCLKRKIFPSSNSLRIMQIPFRLRYLTGYYLGIALAPTFLLLSAFFNLSLVKTRLLGIPIWIVMVALTWLTVLLRKRKISIRTIGETLLSTILTFGFITLLYGLIFLVTSPKPAIIGF